MAKKTVAKKSSKNHFSQFIDILRKSDFEYVDFRFTDLRGKLHHVTQHISTVNEDLLENGILFDGSSIAGWKAINDSDMLLKPDMNTSQPDPFAAHPTLNILCTVEDPTTGIAYNRDPRSIAIAAEHYLKDSGIADTAYFGPEVEFFVFDDVHFKTEPTRSYYSVDSGEFPENSDYEYADGNLGHRPRAKGGYFPVAPIDSLNDLRAEMLSVMAAMGIEVEKHHHEVAPAQCELGIKFQTLMKAADVIQNYKYVVHNVAQVA